MQLLIRLCSFLLFTFFFRCSGQQHLMSIAGQSDSSYVCSQQAWVCTGLAVSFGGDATES